MLIKIDCREKELLDIMKPAMEPTTAVPAPAQEPAPEPDHYIMDLGDGMTMKVPLPKNKALPAQKTRGPKTRPTVSKSLEHHEIKSERLPLGDVILHDPSHGQQKDIVIFERKTLADLAASIRDGRYKEQSFRLIETAAATGFHTHNIVYIIEGDLARYDERHSQITKTALHSAMVSLMYYKGFSVFRTMNVGETADFILHFADKVAKEGPLPAAEIPTPTPTPTASYSEVSAKKEKRDFITRENIGEIMLAQVPGVSAKMASAILTKYGGSIYEFLGDLHRKIANYEESVSPEMSPPSPTEVVPESIEPMNKNKYKHVSECFKDITVDGKRGIGKLTVEKVCYFLG
jgi:ERCC4-type nuclease